MSLNGGFGGATKDFSVDKRFTALEIISKRDCVGKEWLRPALLVHGGARIKKTLCVDDDLIVGHDVTIEGNLVVLGDKVTTEVETVIIQDKTLCIGNVKNGSPTNDTANAGGLLLLGPQPGGTKSLVWYQDIGPSGAWRSNQDFDLGRGRLLSDGSQPECPGCGSDTNEIGSAYRIDGTLVLSLTELGNTVVCSALEKVGTLRKGAIDNGVTISSISLGSPVCITTMEPHCLSVGEQVLLSGTNSTPSIDGCWIVSSVVSATEFKIPTTTISPGTTGVSRFDSFCFQWHR
jgi:hypothetical protein